MPETNLNKYFRNDELIYNIYDKQYVTLHSLINIFCSF